MVYTKCCDIRPAAMLVYDVYVLTVIIYERRKWVAYKGVGMCGGGGGGVKGKECVSWVEAKFDKMPQGVELFYGVLEEGGGVVC